MNSSVNILLVSVMLLFSLSNSYAKSYRIKSVEEYNRISATVLPGDTVIWENGLYNDVVWEIKKNALVIMAADPGMVTFSGSSAVKIAADKVSFSGFQFSDGAIDDDVVEVSGSNVIVSDVNISNYDSHYYFHLSTKGRNNTVEHCNFENKPPAPKGKAGSSIFQVAVDSIHPGYHKIRLCSFKNHTAPPNSGGDYGMEALRIGYSFQSKYISRTIVEYCYFATCNGDGEIISNKARENIFRYNTFENNGESHLTLRHGSDNVVYGNFFVNGAGIRIKEGQNQMVFNNYFNTGKYFAIKLENYKVDPLENIIIVHNTFVRSGEIKMGGKGDFQPQNVMLGNNLFIEPTEAIFTDFTGNETVQNNGFQWDKEFVYQGFKPMPEKINANIHGFYQPQYPVFSKEMQLDFKLTDIPELDDDPLIMLDIAGNMRPPKKIRSAGCFESVFKVTDVKPYATIRNTGPRYLMP
jgi:hypothetical protein